MSKMSDGSMKKGKNSVGRKCWGHATLHGGAEEGQL